MKFSTMRLVLLSTLTLIMAGCQSGRDTQGVSSGEGPIVTKHLPAQAQGNQLAGQPTTKVAVLLPLSGPQGNIGHAMLNAAQMSLFENAPDHLELISEDTRGQPDVAAQVADKAIREGAKIIIGPLFAQEATAVGRVAAQANVPVLSFSNNPVVANQNVFILGFMPEQQMERVFAVAQGQGISRIAVLTSSSEAGQTLRQAAETAARKTGVQLTVVDPYAPGSTDMKNQAAKINQIGAQAVLISEGGQQLRLIMSSLLYNGVDPNKIKFLGTGQWDSPEIYGDRSLNGSWFSASPISLRQQFMKKYAAQYGQQPPRLATLAYDSISMVSLMARNQAPEQGFQTAAMTQPRGYQGIDGIFKLNPDGTVQRGLAVYEISDAKGLSVISPAPEAF